MTATTKPPAHGWSFIIEALADLGAREIERRERAAQQPDRPVRDDADPDRTQHDAEVSEAQG